MSMHNSRVKVSRVGAKVILHQVVKKEFGGFQNPRILIIEKLPMDALADFHRSYDIQCWGRSVPIR